MTTSRELNSKKGILNVIQRMPDNATVDDAIYRLNLLKAVATGLSQAERGLGKDHDEFFDELLNEDTKIQPSLATAGRRRSSTDKKVHRARGAKNGRKVRKTA